MIDFNTDKMLIAYYMPGAGGKTVLNCLGLSEDFCLQEINSPKDSSSKFNFLKSLIDEYTIGTEWYDLDLGCVQLYNLDAFKEKHTAFYHNAVYDDAVIQLFKSGVYMPIVCHNYAQLTNVKNLFPNSKVLSFTNQHEFITKRSPRFAAADKLYQTIRGDSWPADMPIRFSNFSEEVQQEISENFTLLYKFYINRETEESTFLHDIRADYTWNVDWFSNIQKTITEIQSLYSTLGLDNFNRERVEYYYSQWKTKVYDVYMDCK